VEYADAKHFAYTPGKRPVAGDNGDAEVLRDVLDDVGASEELADDCEPIDDEAGIVENLINDGVDPLQVADSDVRQLVTDMMDSVEGQVSTNPSSSKIQPTKDYMDYQIYKSTLVFQLNGNPFLSKDRLTHVKNSICFNNSHDYLNAGTLHSSCLLGIGSDCGVFFMQRRSTTLSSTVKAAARRSST
jgi:hypothetical protein